MDWTEIVARLIPEWLLVMAAATVAVQAVIAFHKYEACIVNRFYFLAIAAGAVPVLMFYIGAALDFWQIDVAVAISRIAWMVQMLTWTAVLQSVCRNNKDDL